MVLLLLSHGAQADVSELDPAVELLPHNEKQQRIAEFLIENFEKAEAARLEKRRVELMRRKKKEAEES
jgi:hypothetical protein